ncbi:probable E3 ubiquitin-protein ligase RHG1A [Prosopis cineraria]|uniref:probable E3 ubiquitin-protein ligase RHG1A n=1 Tax=Prosopis cineraria TaxID=364024 RepID=UPI00240F4F2D|nr:probable E3 ubiquitin-protein ligase RHG1A [Prosopis cineraria]XP_054798371.1 probable E3 ubiquitin-protein ligase RHG1A [Prosopis cineraria]XP_054798372.1 probable E3 ubiquitin-protein ligase RHG1A [Prosopis cineraria]XP_054798373.1 probable E3 ubiquitin-protein ligase RHG1A [Prosopis cineraria]
MDDYSGKRAVDGVVVPKKGMAHVLRDSANARDRNGQFCSRPGCSSRVNSSKGAQIGSSEKGKSSRPSIRPSSRKEAIGSSSRALPGSCNLGKSLTEPQKTFSSQSETVPCETSSLQDGPEISEIISPPEKIRRGPQAEVASSESTNVVSMEVGSSNVASNTTNRRNLRQKPGLSSQEFKSSGSATRTGVSRYGLRNLRCNSISDVIPSGCSSSDSTPHRRRDVMKKRNCEGESSSAARGKKMSGSSLEGQSSGSRNGISISDSRRSRNFPPHRDNSNVALVRTRRSFSGHARGRLSSQANENPALPNQSPITISSLPHSSDLNAPDLLHHTSLDTPLRSPRSYNRPSSSSERLFGVLPSSPSEYGITNSLINRDSFRRYNMDGIAEVLLALERIEQDEDLTHEQILLLETNLFLNGLNFYDQHRDMRLDIDNMSYEELLALEERMGSVSTALTEEALSECLKRAFYELAPSDDAAESCVADRDDTKCSICQEEYVEAEEVGSLQCEHRYHVGCIQQWLRLKNWCPICKASAAPSHSFSSSSTP